MRSKLTIILLFLTISIFAQRVPNTTTFSLQNVVAVTGGTSLNSAFINSVSGNFNSSYGSKNMNPQTLYGFRDYGANIVNISSVTYVRQLNLGTSVSSVEISNDGLHLYLLYPALKIIRHYNLTSPFNISTLSSYSDYSFAFLGGGSYASGLYLSPDERKITFVDGYNIRTLVMSVANNFATEIGVTTYFISSTYMSGSIHSISFDPTGHYATLMGYMVTGQDRTATFYTNATFELSGGVNYVNLSTMTMTGEPRGFEWSSTGYNMYSIDYVTSYINNYAVSPNAYLPSTLSATITGAQSLIISGMLYNDFCFSNSLSKMLAITSGSGTWYLIEFNLQ